MADGDRVARGSAGECPAETTLRVVGGAGKVRVLYELIKGVSRFNALQRALAMAPASLSRRLRELERDRIVARRTRGAEEGYRVTTVGERLRPVLDAMSHWGRRYQR